MTPIASDKTKVSEAVTTQMTYYIDCSLVVLLSLLIQLLSNRHVTYTTQQHIIDQDVLLLDLQTENMKLKNDLKKIIKEKDEFLLGVSHELRNPLNILLGNLELGQMNSKDESNQYMKNAKNSGDMLAFLLNNFLDVGKLQNKNLEIASTHIDVQSLVERTWSISKMMFQRKNLKGQLYLSKEIPKTLLGDPHRIMQIIINLVSNATKFTIKGGVTIIISWVCQKHYDSFLLNKNLSEEFSLGLDHKSRIESLINLDEPNDDIPLSLDEYSAKSRFKSLSYVNSTKKYHKIDFNTLAIPQLSGENDQRKSLSNMGFLKIEVRDTGCGIERDKIPKLFNKFSHDPQNSEHLGTGLGLWVVQNLCANMGGNLKAHSVKNVGSSFVAAIKCPTLATALLSSQSTMSQSTMSAIKSPSKVFRALVVDDMKSNADIHKYFLNKCEIEVPDIASNGMEAVDLYRKKGDGYYNLVFMDRNMPIMDGDKASQMIRAHERRKGWQNTVLVIITGHCQKEDHDALLNPAGNVNADYVFIKPFNFQMCRNLVNSIVSKSCQILSSSKIYQKVLVVDDDHFQTQIVFEYLSKLNIQTFICYNGKEALDTFIERRHEISLVLMDCEMPILNGYETTRSIKSYCRQTHCACPPIIGLTGLIDMESKNRCLQSGMDLVESKPISFGQLKNIISDHKIK
jgi:signal transduction histidine kinase/DNA-binding response OmpR family regulator